VIPVLLRTLHDEHAQLYAWWNLERFAPLDVLLKVAAELLTSRAYLTAEVVCTWLTKQGSAAKPIVSRLLETIDEPSPKLRFAKIEALLAVDPSKAPAALRALEPLFEHELDGVRAEAAKVKQKILDSGQ
jgi:hypothetical protein